MNEIVPHFPDPKEFSHFRERYTSVLKALDDIAGGYEALFTLIQQQDSSKVNDILFLLVGAAHTEYEEILVLALNGYGSGATKLLRALYERTVTAQYLMKNPNKIQQFIDFTHVHWYKLLREADTNGVGEHLSKARRQEIETNFKEVENDFTEIVCKPWNKERLQGSWTKKPLPTQAREISDTLGMLCFQGYLMPTFFLHTTFWGISQQIHEHEHGTKELHNRQMERDHATSAIVLACNLMAHLAENTVLFYKLDAKEHCAKIADATGLIGKELRG
jgi:hypothetical protein